MNLRDRFRAWRRRRSRRDAGLNDVSLREFVYLDDVSVYSLRASQVGLIVTELSETQSSHLQSEIKSSVGASAGVAKGEVSSGVFANESQSSQVLRKALIQTTFKQLYEDARDDLALAPPEGDAAPPLFESLAELTRGADDDSQDWVIYADRLRRGDLVELEVKLEAEPIFHAGAVVSAIHEIIKEDPAVFGLDDISQLGEVRVMSRMVEKLLAGLVPVRGQLLDYSMIELDGRELLVHRAVDASFVGEHNRLQPFVVGVAEGSLFWKDVRRVLFAGSSYRVLGRVARDGFQPSWTPVKLVDVMRDVMPEFAVMMDEMNHGVLPAMSRAVAGQQHDPTGAHVPQALLTYAELLVDRTEDDSATAGLVPEELVGAVPPVGELSIPQWRELCSPITARLEEKTGITIDPSVASECRIAAIAAAGLLPGQDSKPTSATSASRASNERYLDAEIVAVYW